MSDACVPIGSHAAPIVLCEETASTGDERVEMPAAMAGTTPVGEAAPPSGGAPAEDTKTATAIVASPPPPPPASAPSIRALSVSSRALLSSDQLLTSVCAFVRELVENALDSGASNVQLHVRLAPDGSAAIDEIEVRDNGRGIARDEAHLLARPHCTSKIRTFEDIVADAASSTNMTEDDNSSSSSTHGAGVLSFGFRGEALYCISGSCAGLVVQSKRQGDAVAFRASWTKGVRSASDERVAQAGPGTSVKIKGLYYNRPVRAAMAKRDAAQEKQHLQELLRGYAYVHPHVRIICNEPLFNKAAASVAAAATSVSTIGGAPATAVSPGLALFRESIPLVVGTSAGLLQMMEFSATVEDGYRIEGFITRHDADLENKELLRSKSDRIFLYITRTRSLALPWLAKLLVHEWRTLATRQLQRRRLRASGVDPTAASRTDDHVGDEAVTASLLSSRFPLALVRISVPSAESLLDLNRSPDKRDILVGDEQTFRTRLTDAAKSALNDAMDRIEASERREWEEKEREAAAAAEAEAEAAASIDNAADAASASGPSITAASSTEADDASSSTNAAPPSSFPDLSMPDLSPGYPSSSEPSLTPSVSLSPRLTPATPTPTSSSFSSPSAIRRGTAGNVDFSSFARPLAQPQSFHSPKSKSSAAVVIMDDVAPQSRTNGTPVAVASAPVVPVLTSLSPPSSRTSPSYPTPKRARISAAPSSASPLRQTQLSVVDAINSAVTVAPRVIHMDDATLEQIRAGFLAASDEATTPPPIKRAQFVGHLSQPGLAILRLPKESTGDDESSSEEAGSGSDLPTLCAFSTRRAEEVVLFHHLLSSHSVPHVPLDVPIPIDDHFPELTDAERQQVVEDVMSAERMHIEQAVPTGCLTFQQAMQLCGFQMQLASDESSASASSTSSASSMSVALVGVPSDPSISIEDFLSTLRRIWVDSCFQRTRLLKVRPEAINATIGLTPTATFTPNTDWRVDGIRRGILEHACTLAAERQAKSTRTDAAAGTDSTSATMKLVDRLMALVALSAGADAEAAETDWTLRTCPHGQAITHRLTNQRPSKHEQSLAHE